MDRLGLLPVGWDRPTAGGMTRVSCRVGARVGSPAGVAPAASPVRQELAPERQPVASGRRAPRGPTGFRGGWARRADSGPDRGSGRSVLEVLQAKSLDRSRTTQLDRGGAKFDAAPVGRSDRECLGERHLDRLPTARCGSGTLTRVTAATERAAYLRWERRTEKPLLGLSIAFLIVLIVPLTTNPPPTARTVLTVANVLIWAAFAVDYAVRLTLATDRARFVRTHLLDLLVIALPLLRPLRLLRLVRLLRVARLATVAGVVHRRAQRSLHARVTVYVTGATLALVGVSAVAMYDVEHDVASANIHTLPDALWWAATTVTTVGYGDRYPTTEAGRLVAIGLMLAGIALLGVITASIATWFVDRLRQVQDAEHNTEATLTDILTEVRALHARLDALDPGRRQTLSSAELDD